MKKFYLFLLVSIFCWYNVEAATCSTSDLAKLQKEAANVKVNHEIIKETVKVTKYTDDNEPTNETIDYLKKSIKLNISNITENIFIVQTEKDYLVLDNIGNGLASSANIEYSNKKIINYSDSNKGIYTFTSDSINHYIDYKFEIYSNLNNCDTFLIKTITYRQPKYNPYSEYEICKENSNIPACQEFISSDVTLTSEDISKYGGSSSSGILTTTRTSDIKTDNNIKAYIIIGAVIIAGGVTAYIIVEKKRKAI